jgi:hypothetical protein
MRHVSNYRVESFCDGFRPAPSSAQRYLSVCGRSPTSHLIAIGGDDHSTSSSSSSISATVRVIVEDATCGGTFPLRRVTATAPQSDLSRRRNIKDPASSVECVGGDGPRAPRERTMSGSASGRACAAARTTKGPAPCDRNKELRQIGLLLLLLLTPSMTTATTTTIPDDAGQYRMTDDNLRPEFW